MRADRHDVSKAVNPFRKSSRPFQIVFVDLAVPYPIPARVVLSVSCRYLKRQLHLRVNRLLGGQESSDCRSAPLDLGTPPSSSSWVFVVAEMCPH